MNLSFTRHARQVMAERDISQDWVEAVLDAPGFQAADPNDSSMIRFYGRVPERDNRVLRVVVNITIDPWRVVSVFFDRRMRDRL